MEAVSRRTALLGALGLAVAGCTQPGQSFAPISPPVMTPSPSLSPTPTADTLLRWPLTGRLVKDPAETERAAVALKVSDIRAAHPQIGVDKADIVFVEPNGDAYTRLCAVFHSTMPALVGPIRSIRPVDVPLLSPMRPVFGNTSAAAWVMNYVKYYERYLENLYYMRVRGSGSYDIDASRVERINGTRDYEHAVFCHPTVLAKQTKRFTAPPPQYLPFATTEDEVSTLSGKPGRQLTIPYGAAGRYAMSYSYDEKSNRYLRSEPWGKHITQDGTRVSADSVLVVRARWTMDKIYQGGGAPDPVVEIIKNTGDFFYAYGGRYVTGTWSKGEVSELFEFALPDGSPLRIALGRTWVEIPQKNAKVAVKA